ncbi:leucine--tRNA ligase [Patescibacteria group bacterium]|nr:leucine--tRNA ligase [Patescibacteria group bacterium]MCL5010400.1 leucine--tRNA ligase [Patescibacteria group bacterium]
MKNKNTKYIPREIEKKWQEIWERHNLYGSDLSKSNKYYVLAEFPYPSGDLHMGHWFTFCGADIYARFKRMQGYTVFFPNGFDAFGLPAENAAIKRNIHPRDWTMSNIKRMKEQFATMGGSFTYDHEVITCLSEYYKWNQWIFIEMFKKGLAYRAKTMSNWCPVDQTVLANEHVVDGLCWRCGAEVVQKEVEQWFLRITAYADRLKWPENPSVDWPESVRRGQNDWIGKSEGAEVEFGVENSELSIKVFTTRLDTLYGATFLVLAPEHPLIAKIVSEKQKKTVEAYQRETEKKTELMRKETRVKTGVFTGAYAVNPINKEKLPVWVSDYALITYGTGALFGDAHDERDSEFAKRYGIALKPTVITGNREKDGRILSLKECFTGYGTLVDSGEFSGLASMTAKKKILEKLVKNGKAKPYVTYHLHDWSVSRQRYWGTPVPMIHCRNCGIVPVPEKDLPLELPYEVDYAPKGKPPLASNIEWMRTKCPKCDETAKRDAETMDTFVDSSWYFLRYLDPKLKDAAFDKKRSAKIMPVDIYFGGAEHTLGHTLYSRFFTKFFYDLGMVDFEEYAKRRVNHGIVLGPDGEKMSKSKGNVVNPDAEVAKYGADAVRVFVAFFMPYDGTGPWISDRIWGAYRFLERVWKLKEKADDHKMDRQDLLMMHKTIKKVGGDIAGIKFNTAVAALMEWLNYLSRKAKNKKQKVSWEEYRVLLILLAPFAPHMTEELWQRFLVKPPPSFLSVHCQKWPKYDPKFLEEEEATIVVQVNGRVRDSVKMQNAKCKMQNYVEEKARESERVSKHLEGRSVKKVIYIEGKIINFVTED